MPAFSFLNLTFPSQANTSITPMHRIYGHVYKDTLPNSVKTDCNMTCN